MFDYNSLKQYIVPHGTVVHCKERRHCFYEVREEEIAQAERMLSMSFPDELRQFYLNVGYGYFGNDDPDFLNQLMHPIEIAKLKLGLDFYGNMYEEELEYYTSDAVFPFFDLGGESDYLVIQMEGEGSGSILYFDTCIASSFHEFAEKMCKKTDYFISAKAEHHDADMQTCGLAAQEE